MQSNHPAEGTPPAPAPGYEGYRRIIHVDMDSYFASVEVRDDPSLAGRPVAVGGSRERGVVAAANYEARKYGVRSAMPSVQALRLCPELVFVPPRFEVYRAVTAQIREIFLKHTPLVEPLSLDEAYLDVTGRLTDQLPTATKMALAIKKEIREVTGLTASAGVSYNKVLAKLASDYRKPDGFFVITPDLGPEFVLDLDITKFHGVGPATKEKMHSFGIRTGRDLRERSLEFLQEKFGKAGTYFYGLARGQDDRPVNPDRPRKSCGAENTFPSDLSDFDDLAAELDPIVAKAWDRCERTDSRGRTVTLKVKFSDFTQITRSRSLPREFESEEEVMAAALDLLRDVVPARLGIRLLGVTVSGFANATEGQNRPARDDAQMSLF